MRGIHETTRPVVQRGLEGASYRLVNDPGSPLWMGVCIGLVYIVDGATPGFAFCANHMAGHEFEDTGFPRSLWLAYADYLEALVSEIRAGVLDDFLKPAAERMPTEGSA